jgi:hypothetical protein
MSAMPPLYTVLPSELFCCCYRSVSEECHIRMQMASLDLAQLMSVWCL